MTSAHEALNQKQGDSGTQESPRMSTPISVTFDSNVWEAIADPAKLAAHADAVALGEIRRAIEDSRVTPYLSDVVVLLESIRKADRGKFFADIKTAMRRSEGGQSIDPSGVPVIKSTLTVTSAFDHFPQLHEKLSSSLERAFALGFQLIRVPRIGWMRLDEELYKPQETDEVSLGARLDRTHHAGAEFEAAGCGVAWATKLGEDAIARDPQVAARTNRNPFFALAYCGNPAAISEAIAEWADGDALAAHHGHEHDVFCTLDRGRGAGMQSVLHQSRRQWLKDDFGIAILAPVELAARLNPLISAP
jgi:hypothetical protein